MYRSAKSHGGQIFQVFTLGGRISRLAVNSSTWTEFDPDGEDLFQVRAPRIEGARICYTNTSTFPDLVSGDEVTSAHLEGVDEIFPGKAPYGFDRDDGLEGKPGFVRHFFAIVPDEAPAPGAPATTSFMTFTAGAR